MNILEKTVISIGFLSVMTYGSAQAVSGMTGGGAFGTNGAGAYLSGTTGLELGEGKALQWRVVVSGLSFDDEENFEINDIEYDGDIDVFGAQFGLDWYPFKSNSFFFSGGINYFDREFDLRSDRQSSLKIGGQRVNGARNVTINTNIDHSSAAPYVSVGWGNKHKKTRGFAFFAEIGVQTPLDDSEVSVTANGNNGIVSQAALDAERRDIQDDLDGVQLLANVGFGYHF